ncbi:hypothetical protein QTI66_27515 [Variovorax sp. J22R133]|uniref:hypothetical protein n=1 Tax=Variovorax brevis TaxID=3053503 RepID=UPI0025785C50|nr:hypothetical protein [Variovorax sp. J22R133]MDM0115928.1 hypothetical protein [Variovorax sp. J22R133]
MAALLLTASAANAADEAEPVRLYDLVIQTGMPHLEENLRYADTRERRCVDTRDLSQMFPVLRHVSLQDCVLAKDSGNDAVATTYVLKCTGGHGTSGGAQWQWDAQSISGTLSVRLGGKNMTFYQRITGQAVGACKGS